METKLTLRLNNKVIIKAKDYAQSHRISLSKIVESYLDSLAKPNSDDSEITPLVKSLSGVIKLPNEYDYKKDYTDYLADKYK